MEAAHTEEQSPALPTETEELEGVEEQPELITDEQAEKLEKEASLLFTPAKAETLLRVMESVMSCLRDNPNGFYTLVNAIEEGNKREKQGEKKRDLLIELSQRPEIVETILQLDGMCPIAESTLRSTGIHPEKRVEKFNSHE